MIEDIKSVISVYLTPIFALLFFTQGIRIFISGIYYVNLASLSLNFVSLSFIIILFLTPLTKYLIPRLNENQSILVLGLITAGLRLILIFLYPRIEVRSNPSPMLIPIIFVTGLLCFFSIALLAKSLSQIITYFNSEKSTNTAGILTSIYVFVIGIDTIIIYLGYSLDISTSSDSVGFIFTLILISIFLISLLIGYRYFSNQSIAKSNPNSLKSKSSVVWLLAGSLGLILFFEASLLGSPYIFIAWTNTELRLSLIIYAIILAIIIASLSFPEIQKLMHSKSLFIIFNILLLVFIVVITFIQSTDLLITSAISILAGLSQFTLIIDFYWFSSRLRTLPKIDVLRVVGISPIIYVSCTLYIAFTFSYTALPGTFLDPIFKGLLFPFLILMALILFGASYRSLQEIYT